jgi:hypothetical protein
MELIYNFMAYLEGINSRRPMSQNQAMWQCCEWLLTLFSTAYELNLFWNIEKCKGVHNSPMWM